MNKIFPVVFIISIYFTGLALGMIISDNSAGFPIMIFFSMIMIPMSLHLIFSKKASNR